MLSVIRPDFEVVKEGLISNFVSGYRRFDADRQIKHLSTLSEYSLNEHQFAQLVGKSRLYHYLPVKIKKDLDTAVPISDTQISMVGKDYYQDKSFCR
jgi:hypothetical protein